MVGTSKVFRNRFAVGLAAVISLLLVAMLSAGVPAKADADTNLSTAAAKKSVWVVTKIVHKDSSGKTTETMDYTPKGLVAKQKIVRKSSDGTKDTWVSSFTYSNNYQLKTEVEKYNGKTTATTKYKCNKKGYVTKGTATTSYGTSVRGTNKYNSKGRLVKVIGMVGTDTYTYDSNGRVKSVKNYSEEFDETTVTKYTYDKYGFVKKDSNATYKNKVKNGRLVKRTMTDSLGGKTVTTYTYKKISVPAAAVKMINSQQDGLIQGILPFRTAHK